MGTAGMDMAMGMGIIRSEEPAARCPEQLRPLFSPPKFQVEDHTPLQGHPDDFGLTSSRAPFCCRLPEKCRAGRPEIFGGTREGRVAFAGFWRGFRRRKISLMRAVLVWKARWTATKLNQVLK